MKYWGFFTMKALAAAGLLRALWPLYRDLFRAADPLVRAAGLDPMGHDLGYTVAVYLFWLFAAGIAWLVIWDQRYRCRTCLRRLRMPVRRGSYNRMLLVGRPHTEYICAYGHGALKVPELHITGKEPNDWAANQDMWKELELLDSDKR